MTGYTAELRSIYFMRPVGERGPIKVGCSIQPHVRREQLQTQVGRKLEIITIIPGSMDDERRIHSAFWADHIGGEWFNWSAPLQSLVTAAAYGGFDFDTLPPAKIRPMPGKRHSWTEDQKLRARLSRRIRKAERATGRSFPHQIGHYSLRSTWKGLIPEIEQFLAEAA